MSALPATSNEMAERVPGVEEGLRLDRWADMLGIGNKAVLTTAETAEVLRVSERSVREGIKAGAIPCIRLGRRLLVPVPMLLSSLLRGPRTDESLG